MVFVIGIILGLALIVPATISHIVGGTGKDWDGMKSDIARTDPTNNKTTIFHIIPHCKSLVVGMTFYIART